MTAVGIKRPKFWESDDWLLPHGNAQAHILNLVQQYCDAAPYDLRMFSKLKPSLKEHRFDDVQTIETNATNVLNKKRYGRVRTRSTLKSGKGVGSVLFKQIKTTYFAGFHKPDDVE